MTRRMSCSMTVDAVLDQSKTVTRRHVETWKDLKPGDRLTLIEKGMGLKKGEKQRVLASVEVVAVDVEQIGYVNMPGECAREGFPDKTPAEFIAMWLESHGYKDVDDWSVPCRRIVWEYL